MTDSRPELPYLKVALILFFLAIPWRIAQFCGFGLGDDVNDVHVASHIVANGGFDPLRSETYRMMTTGLRALSFAMFGANEVTLVALPFLFVTGAHLIGIFMARDLLGTFGAFMISLFFFASPFESLSATANVTDYIHGFFALGAVWCLAVEHLRSSEARMRWGAVFVFGAVLNKVSGLGMLPVIGLGTLCAGREWRRFIPFWTTFAALIFALCVWDFSFSGKPLRWILFNNFFEGYNAWVGPTLEDRIWKVWEVWKVLPNDILSTNYYGDRFFGFIGWLWVPGMALALLAVLFRKGSVAATVVVLYGLVYFVLFNCMPHKLTLDGYYSHTRVWRYLAQYAPAIYFSATYLVVVVDRVARRFIHLPLGFALGLGVASHALITTPETTLPSRDANSDGRRLVQFFRENPPPEGVPIYVDFVRNMWLSALYQPQIQRYGLQCTTSTLRPEILKFMNDAKEGTIITGGSSLAWYGNLDLNYDVDRPDFSIPPTWQLVKEFSSPKTPWRNEPLRVWYIEPEPREASIAPKDKINRSE